ncbi:MAG TPA: class I SAM-dependent methyltransferase [Actinospica sp.]|nr:class I SAM-dependent methyltransferase [Actinospica sp.]
MLVPSPRVLRALERLNAAYPWDHNAHYHPWILSRLPGTFATALDIGSGTGDLARLLAERATSRVDGIDSDPAIVARAQSLTPPGSPLTRTAADASAPPPVVTFTTADALTGIPDDRRYDVITCVATIHHLPFAEALRVFREHLAPGGTLVVLGLSRPTTREDFRCDLASAALNPIMGMLKNRGRRADRPASMTARTRHAEMSYPGIARETAAILPGAELRRCLFWRYSLVWHMP